MKNENLGFVDRLWQKPSIKMIPVGHLEIGGVTVSLVQMYLAEGASAIRTDEQGRTMPKCYDLIVKEAKVPQHYAWVVFNEVPAENWMIDQMKAPELKAKLAAEKKLGNLASETSIRFAERSNLSERTFAWRKWERR